MRELKPGQGVSLPRKLVPNPRLNWVGLRKIASWRLVTTSYIWLFIVPACVKLLSPFEGPHDIELPRVFGEEKPFHVELSLPFAWECFFLMALLFVIGRVVFFLVCPPIIQTYASFGEYRSANPSNDVLLEFVEGLMGRASPLQCFALSHPVVNKGDTEAQLWLKAQTMSIENVRKMYFAHITVAVEAPPPNRTSESEVGHLFNQATRLSAGTRPGWCMASTLSLVLGLLLLGFVVVQNVWHVGKYWLAESRTETAYRVCGDCGLDVDWWTGWSTGGHATPLITSDGALVPPLKKIVALSVCPLPYPGAPGRLGKTVFA